MALTRKMLKAMGIEDEKIDQIIEAHTEVTDELKHERDQYKESAEKLPSVQEELDKLKAKPGDGFKERYEKEHEEYEAFKASVKAEDEKRKKSAVYRAALMEAGVDQKRIDTVMKVADLDSFEMKDGKATDPEALVEAVRTDWADFIPVINSKPANIDTPPASKPGDPEPHSIAEAMRLESKK